MSFQRTCSKCGWLYPSTYKKNNCTFCLMPLNVIQCAVCKEYKTPEFFSRLPTGKVITQCYTCHREFWAKRYYEEVLKERYLERRREANVQMDRWLKNPDLTFKPMSEAEWLETCQFFKGCALCQEPHIETRAFLLPFQHGGRYAPWNVLPMCGKCAVYERKLENPFIWLNYGAIQRKLGFTKERAQLIQEYFIKKVEQYLEQQGHGIQGVHEESSDTVEM